MTWGAVAIGGAGLIGSLAGGVMAGDASNNAAQMQNQAGADARNQYDQRTAEGALRQLAMLYGPTKAKSIFRATFPKDTVDKIFGTPATAGTPGTPPTGGGGQTFSQLQDAYNAALRRQQDARQGGYSDVGNMQNLASLRQQLDDASTNGTRGTAGTAATDAVPGTIDMSAFDAGGPGIESQMNDYRNQAKTAGDQYLTGFDNSTQGLLRDSQGIEKMALGYGDGERTRINRDAATALTGANRVTEGRMRANGLGTSSALGNQLGANATSNFNATQDQLSGLGDRQIAMNTGLKQNTLALKSGRQGTRDAAAMNLQERDLGLAAKPIDMALQNATGAAMNPWLGQNTTQYFPGAAGGGGAVIGNTLSAMGGQLTGFGAQTLANGQSNNQLQQLLLQQRLSNMPVPNTGLSNYGNLTNISGSGRNINQLLGNG